MSRIMTEFVSGLDAGIHLERDPAEVAAPQLLDAINVDLARPAGVIRKRLGSRYYGDDYANGLITPADFDLGVQRVVKLISVTNSEGVRFLIAIIATGTVSGGLQQYRAKYNKPDVDQNWAATYQASPYVSTFYADDPIDHTVLDNLIILPSQSTSGTGRNYAIYFGPDGPYPVLITFGNETAPGGTNPTDAGAGGLTGTYRYVSTLYSPWTNSETLPSAPASITVAAKDVQITIPTAPPSSSFTNYRIYRTVADGGTLFLLKEGSASGGPITDSTDDDALGVEQPPIAAGPSPACKVVGGHKSRLFYGHKTADDVGGPQPSLGWYTQAGRIGQVDWQNDSIRFGGPNSEGLTAIFPLFDQLYASTASKIFHISGLTPPYQVVEVVNEGGYGILNPNTAVEIEGRVFGLSRKGPFIFDGRTPRGLESPLLPIFRERARIAEQNHTDWLHAREVPWRWRNNGAGTVTVADVRIKFNGTTTTPATITVQPDTIPSPNMWAHYGGAADALAAVTDGLDSTSIRSSNQDAQMNYPIEDLPDGAGTVTSVLVRLRGKKGLFSSSALRVICELFVGSGPSSAGSVDINLASGFLIDWWEGTIGGLNVSAADFNLGSIQLTNDLDGQTGSNEVYEIELVPTYAGPGSIQTIAQFQTSGGIYGWRIKGRQWSANSPDLSVPAGTELAGSTAPHTVTGETELEDGHTYSVYVAVDAGSGFDADQLVTENYTYTSPAEDGQAINWGKINQAWAIDHWPTREYWLAVPSHGSDWPDVIYALDYERLNNGGGISWRRILAPACSGVMLPLLGIGGSVPEAHYPLIGDASGRVWVYQWPHVKDHLGLGIGANINFDVIGGSLTTNSTGSGPDPSPAGTWSLSGGASLVTANWGHQGELVTLRSTASGKTYTGVIVHNTATTLTIGAWLDSRTPPDGVYDWSLYGIEASFQLGWFAAGDPTDEKHWKYLTVQQSEPYAALHAELLFTNTPGPITETHRRRWARQLRDIAGGKVQRKVPIMGRGAYMTARLGNPRSIEPFTITALGLGYSPGGGALKP